MKKPHPIINYFTLKDNRNFKYNLCYKEYNFPIITTLKKHYETKHLEIWNQIKCFSQINLKKQKTITNSTTNQIEIEISEVQSFEQNLNNELQSFKPPESFKAIKNINSKNENNINIIEIENGTVELNDLKIEGKCKIYFK